LLYVPLAFVILSSWERYFIKCQVGSVPCTSSEPIKCGFSREHPALFHLLPQQCPYSCRNHLAKNSAADFTQVSYNLHSCLGCRIDTVLNHKKIFFHHHHQIHPPSLLLLHDLCNQQQTDYFKRRKVNKCNFQMNLVLEVHLQRCIGLLTALNLKSLHFVSHNVLMCLV